MKSHRLFPVFVLSHFLTASVDSIFAAVPQALPVLPHSAEASEIKAYCIDFNWAATDRKRKPFAAPGTWAGADPAQHVAWYKSVGANVIQTFCVSSNGYAWYKNGFVAEQPGLKHDFLPEVVKLGHKEEMLVIGYFCVGANPKWAVEHPDLSYGKPTTYHIPGSTCSRMRGGLKKADMLILIGVTYNNLQERKQHVHELTLPCIRGAWLQAQED